MSLLASMAALPCACSRRSGPATPAGAVVPLPSGGALAPSNTLPQRVSQPKDASEVAPPPLLQVSLARPGRPLIVPVEPAPEAIRQGWLPLAVEPSGRWASRAPLIRFVRAQPLGSAPPDPHTAAARRWLALPPSGSGVWSSLPAGSDAPSLPGFWAAVIDVPSDTGAPYQRPPFLTLDSRRVPLVWGSPNSGAAASPRQARPSSVFQSAVVAELSASPWTRPLLSSANVNLADDEFRDPLINAASEQIRAVLNASFARVLQTTPELAPPMRALLIPAIRFDDRLSVPMPADASRLAALALRVLDPQASVPSIVQSARGWIDAESVRGAWILDDAPSTDAAGLSSFSLGAINRSPELVAFTVVGQALRSPDALPIPPLSCVMLSLFPAPPAAGSPEMIRSSSVLATEAPAPPRTLPTLDVIARLDQRDLPRRPVPGAVPVRPPGAAIGPLLPDWSFATLAASAEDPSPAPPTPAPANGEILVARLFRDPSAPDAWSLYIECQSPAPSAGSAGPSSERVEIHLGPATSPRAVLTLTPDGSVTIKSGASNARPLAQLRAAVMPASAPGGFGSWAVTVPLPATAIETAPNLRAETTRVLRIGLLRESRGARWAWPRPMLPWDASPPRALFDLGDWSRPAAE